MRLAAAVLVSLACRTPAGAQPAPNARPPILRGAGDTLRVRLLDAATGRPLAGAAVTVYSDNGIRCDRAPCPTNGRTWQGRTGATGWLALPRTEIQQTVSVSTPTRYGDLVGDATRAAGGWVLRMRPR
jgi:hypothetical protein